MSSLESNSPRTLEDGNLVSSFESNPPRIGVTGAFGLSPPDAALSSYPADESLNFTLTG